VRRLPHDIDSRSRDYCASRQSCHSDVLHVAGGISGSLRPKNDPDEVHRASG
jgi:hypothetical protein